MSRLILESGWMRMSRMVNLSSLMKIWILWVEWVEWAVWAECLAWVECLAWAECLVWAAWVVWIWSRFVLPSNLLIHILTAALTDDGTDGRRRRPRRCWTIRV